MTLQLKNYESALMYGAANSLTVPQTIQAATSQAFAVGLNGATNPAFNIDSSTALQADGLNVKALDAGNGAQVSVITSGTNSPLTIDSAGSGTITIAGTSTGGITLGTQVTASNGIIVASAKKIEGAGTGANGIVLKNLKNAAAGTLSGTQKQIEIDIGGVPYYFLVSPTSS